MRFELAVLDMAGTTVRDDDAVNRSLQKALAQHEVKATREEINEVMGMPKPLAIQHVLRNHGALESQEATAKVKRVHSDFVEFMIAFYRTDPAVQEVRGATAVFRELRQMGLKVALDTGFSRSIAQVILERLGWLGNDLLQATVTSDEVAQGRPHPHLIFRAMKLTGVKSAATVVKIGDTPSDLQEGTAAQCGLVVGVTNGSHTREQLAGHPHSLLIDDLRELPRLIASRHQDRPLGTGVGTSPRTL